ncbi:unnamed protein product [Urochloa humidicola]
MAGAFSRALWPWGSGRPSSSSDSSSSARDGDVHAFAARASWRSPTIDRRLDFTGASPPSSAPRLGSSSPPPRIGRPVPPTVRFTTPPSRFVPSYNPIHRVWRAATPFPTASATSTPSPPTAADDITEVHMPHVDMDSSRILAYAFVEPACADPSLFIRIALERHGGDPPVRLAPSSHGTMMVVFGHSYFRKTTICSGPINMDGHQLRLVRHEEAEFRVICPYKRLMELAATDFPPEHWNENGIRRAFQVWGQVCSIASSCLREVEVQGRPQGVADYSVVRVLVLVDENQRITRGLLVRNPNGEISGIAKVRMVGDWAHPLGSPPPDDHQFSDSMDDDAPRADASTPRAARTGSFQPPSSGSSRPRSRFRREAAGPGPCRALGSVLFPSAPLWTFVTGAATALARALSLAGVPVLTIRDLPTPTRPGTPPLPTPPGALFSDNDEITCVLPQARSVLPSLGDLLEEEEHEVSLRKRRVRRKRAVDSASKVRRSRRLAAKEIPFYEDATAKATRVKVAQLDLAKASARMKEAVQSSGILSRPAPKKMSPWKLRCLGRACGLGHLSELEDEVATTA